MPIYEYKCQECGEHIEKMQKISEEPLRVCEACGGKLEKQWSRSGFQFKGQGWYVTDYAGKKGSSSDKPEKSGKSEKSEKSPPAESTAKSDSASKQTKETASDAKKD